MSRPSITGFVDTTGALAVLTDSPRLSGDCELRLCARAAELKTMMRPKAPDDALMTRLERFDFTSRKFVFTLSKIVSTRIERMERKRQDASMNEKRLHWELTQEIIGAFYTVYNEFGYGFLENVYKNALVLELQTRDLKVERESCLFRVIRFIRVDELPQLAR